MALYRSLSVYLFGAPKVGQEQEWKEEPKSKQESKSKKQSEKI